MSREGFYDLELISAHPGGDPAKFQKLFRRRHPQGGPRAKKHVNYRKRKWLFSDTQQRLELIWTGVLHGISRRIFYFFIIPGQVSDPRVDFSEMFPPRAKFQKMGTQKSAKIESNWVQDKDYGPILWESRDLPSIINFQTCLTHFRPMLGPKIQKRTNKNKTIQKNT